jgi:hypothetical protein
MKDLRITYNVGNITENHFDCACCRWDVQDKLIIIETFMTKAENKLLYDSIKPGAVGELYTILGVTKYYDQTWLNANTIKITPLDIGSSLYTMRNEEYIAIKTYTTSPFKGPNKLLNVKIEAFPVDEVR